MLNVLVDHAEGAAAEHVNRAGLERGDEMSRVPVGGVADLPLTAGSEEHGERLEGGPAEASANAVWESVHPSGRSIANLADAPHADPAVATTTNELRLAHSGVDGPVGMA